MRSAGYVARSVLALALSVCLALAVRAPAAAPHASLELVDGTLSMSNSKAGAAILSASGMGPGDVATGNVTIANTGSVSGDFSLSAFDVTDVPGTGGGLLSTALDATILDLTEPAAPRQVYSGSLGAMTTLDLGSFAAGSRHTYSFSVGMGPGVRFDSVQSGAVSVGYRWTASASADGGDTAPPTTSGTTPAPPPTTGTTQPPPTTTTPPPPPTGPGPLKLTLAGPRSWSVRTRRGPAVTARCTRACTLRAKLKVNGAGGRVALKVQSKATAGAAGSATRFNIVVSARALGTIRKALARRRRISIAVSVTATDKQRLTAKARKRIQVKR